MRTNKVVCCGATAELSRVLKPHAVDLSNGRGRGRKSISTYTVLSPEFIVSISSLFTVCRQKSKSQLRNRIAKFNRIVHYHVGDRVLAFLFGTDRLREHGGPGLQTADPGVVFIKTDSRVGS